MYVCVIDGPITLLLRKIKDLAGILLIGESVTNGSASWTFSNYSKKLQELIEDTEETKLYIH